MTGMVEPCAKCGGAKCYSYDENHSKVCEACCPHDGGWWLLERHYGERNGHYCCKLGCGFTKHPSDLGITLPKELPPLGFDRIASEEAACRRGLEAAAKVARSYEEGLGPAQGWTDEFKDGFETGVADAAGAIEDAIKALSPQTILQEKA